MIWVTLSFSEEGLDQDIRNSLNVVLSIKIVKLYSLLMSFLNFSHSQAHRLNQWQLY